MNQKIEEAVKNLRNLLQEECNPPDATIGTIILKLESNSHGWVCRWADASVALSKYGKTILSSSEWLPYTEKLWSEVSKKYRT